MRATPFLNENALTKFQAVFLAALVIVSAICGSIAFVLWRGTATSGETIKVGVCVDLDMPLGKAAWQGALLAVEQINAEGGLLGRKVELVGEDTDTESAQPDFSQPLMAFTRLISVHNVDFVVAGGSETFIIDKVGEYKRIVLGTAMGGDSLTQRVIDDYDRYKYYFRILPNQTSSNKGSYAAIQFFGELAGFNKVAFVATEYGTDAEESYSEFTKALEDRGFEIVYDARFPIGTVDFGSYFTQAEAAGAEIMLTSIMTQEGIPFVKEWHDRQSPMMLGGINYVGTNSPQSWEWTQGKCQYALNAPGKNYPLTSKTLPLREAFLERWETLPSPAATRPYDALRFILFEAIKRAGTTETEDVIKALEETDVETSEFTLFAFTASHDMLVTEDSTDFEERYGQVVRFQWQANATTVPIYPQELMEEIGATLKFPDWPGWWDN